MEYFSCFLSLPLELQDRIWELSIPIPLSAAAYHAQLVHQAKHRIAGGSADPYNTKDRVYLYRHPDPHRSTDRDHAMSTLASLLTTCRRSSILARHIHEALKPKIPFLLYKSDPNFHSSLEIDAMADLVILQGGWQRPIGITSVTRTVQLDPLRYLGLSWPGSGACGLHTLEGLLALWGYKLRALYIVVNPDDLCAAEGRRDTLWDDPSGLLNNYLESYDCDTALAFRCGQRVYFEMSRERVMRSEGLEEVVQLLAWTQQLTMLGGDSDRDKEAQQGPPSCKVMTWRLA